MEGENVEEAEELLASKKEEDSDFVKKRRKFEVCHCAHNVE
jgi:hypothetical protein